MHQARATECRMSTQVEDLADCLILIEEVMCVIVCNEVGKVKALTYIETFTGPSTPLSSCILHFSMLMHLAQCISP